MDESIMIVDDTIFIRKMLSIALSAVGYDNIYETDSAREALYKLTHGTRPALIITAADMPQMDGMALPKRIREIPRHRKVPILTLTSSCGRSSTCTDCKEIGADALLKKPFTVEELYEVVESVLNRS